GQRGGAGTGAGRGGVEDAGGGVEPVALPLERVGRQGGQRPGGGGEFPVHGQATGVGLGQGEGEPVAVVAAERAEDRGGVLIEGLLDADGQYRVGAGLDEKAVSALRQGLPAFLSASP